LSERGTATKIDGSEVTVRIDLEANCAGCMNREGCALAGTFITAFDPEKRVHSPGDKVEIEIPARAQAAGAFWLLGLPLALFAAGYAAGASLFPGSGEGPAALLSIGGFALGIGAAVLLLKSRRAATQPRITRVLQEAGA